MKDANKPWRIATWNLDQLRCGKRHETNLLRLIQSVNADVWVLTESHRLFSPGPAYELAACSAPAQDLGGDNGKVWVALWTRNSFPALSPCATGDPERVACATIQLSEGRSVTVYGTVLPWRSDGGTAAYCQAVQKQGSDWLRLQQPDPKHSLCVLGDFNEELSGAIQVGSKLGRESLATALRSANLACLTSDQSDPVIQRWGQANIDHVCVGAGLIPVGSPPGCTWCRHDEEGRELTDHFGVYVDLMQA